MTPKEKAIEIVKELEEYLDTNDVYWNVTDDAKICAKKSIKLTTDNSEYWQKVIAEIDNLPTYIQDVE
ncbi:hypothetical protein [uncultured Draconibacterium sp.]|uniref:hypothetical protein n=1 Tax=uncultured Draconibacterium sp. TaxID=1573823 RepID=UPI0025FC3416|nr:hypothetical protein [uncultured Draconibacterium sp.]